MKRSLTILVVLMLVILGATRVHATEVDPEQRALVWLLATLAEEEEAPREAIQDVSSLGKLACAQAATAFLLEADPERERYSRERARLEARLLRVLEDPPGFVGRTWLYGFLGLWLAEKGMHGDDVREPYGRILAGLTSCANAEGGFAHGRAFKLPGYPSTMVAATNWALITYGNARRLDIEVDDEIVARAVALLDDVQGASGAFPYGGRTFRKGYEAGRTAGVVAALAVLGRQDTPTFRRAAEYVLKNMAAVPHGHASPSMHVLLGSLAFRALGEDAWKAWDDGVLETVRGYQGQDGSYDILSTDSTAGASVRFEDRATRIYVTACCAAALAMPRARVAAGLAADLPLPPTPEPLVPTYVETAWSADISPYARVAADDGRVYLMDVQQGYEVLRADDGTVLAQARFQTPGEPPLFPMRLTVDGDRAQAFLVDVAHANDAGAPMTCMLLDAAQGTVRWTRTLACRPVGVDSGGGQLHTLLMDGSVVVLSEDDGSEIRKESPARMPSLSSGLSVNDDGDAALAVNTQLEVRDGSGAVRWQATVPTEAHLTPPSFGALVWADGLLVVSRADGQVLAYAAEDGAGVWTTSGRAGVATLTFLETVGGVLVQDFEGAVRALAADDGRTLWSFAPPCARERVDPTPVRVREGLVVVPSPGDGLTFFLDQRTGEVRHVLRTSGQTQIAVDAGMIYVADQGRLWALRRPADELNAAADSLLTVGDAAGAQALLDRAAPTHPDDGGIQQRRGRLLYDAGSYQAAADAFSRAAALGALDAAHAVYHGHCYVALGDPEHAKDAYIAGLAIEPSSEAPVRGGLLHLAGDDADRLVALLEEAVDVVPTSWAARYHLGYACVQQERWDEAAEHLTAAWALEGAPADVGMLLGWVQEQRGEDEAACACYRKVLEADPSIRQAATHWDALLRERTSGIVHQQEEYEALLRLAPDDPLIKNNYAYLLRRDAERMALLPRHQDVVPSLFRRSVEVYTETAALLPDDPQIQSDTGLVYEYYPCVRDDAVARGYFLRALELTDYRYRDALNGMIRICERNRDWTEMRRITKRALDRFATGAPAIVPAGSEGKPTAMDEARTRLVVEAVRLADRAAEARLDPVSPMRLVSVPALRPLASFDTFDVPEDWTLEAPASAPEGEAQVVAYRFAADSTHRLEAHRQGRMTQGGRGGPYELSRSMRIAARADPDGDAGAEVALTIEHAATPGAPARARVYEVSLRPDGRAVPGTVRTVPEARRPDTELAAMIGTVLPPLPDRPVRVGETWAVDVDVYTASMCLVPFEQADLHAAAWQTLEAFEVIDGVRCARIRTVFLTALRSHTFLLRPGGTSPGSMVLRGTSTMWLGEDGCLRRHELKTEQATKVADDVMGSILPLELRDELTLTGRLGA